MGQQDRAQSRQFRQSLPQICFADIGEIVHSRRCEETLEPEHALPHQRLDLSHISRNYAAPESDIHPAFPARGCQLGAETLDRRRSRSGIERHVHERGHATGRRRFGCRAESLPLRPPGLVNVYVRIHQAGKYLRVTGCENGAISRGSLGKGEEIRSDLRRYE